MALADMKMERDTAKRNLTRKLNAIKVSLAEGDLDVINNNEIIQLYRKFSETHEIYSEEAVKAKDETLENLDAYFELQQ